MQRRAFVQKSLMGMAGFSLLLPGMAAAAKKKSPSDRMTFALIGCKGVGWNNMLEMQKHPEAQMIALCDVDTNVLNQRAAEFEQLTGRKPALYTDYRKLLERKDLDAVIIATPDHWHALQTIHACEAGKDVYVEKPLANAPAECWAMVNAAKHFNRVVQVGQQQRSAPHWQDALAFVHSGELGHIRNVKAWAFLNWKGEVPVKPDSAVPQGVDYDMWLGPAPATPFNENRFHFNFRWFWEYAGGLMTDWGVHMIDIVMLGMKAGAPKAVLASGGKYAFPNDAMQTPDTLQAIYEFDDFLMSWEHTIGLGIGYYGCRQGVAFYGSNGTLVASREGWQIYPEENIADTSKYKMCSMPYRRASGNDRMLHTADFVSCVKTRNTPICSITDAAEVCVNAHLGNIAYRTGRKIYYDSASKTITGDKEAQDLLSVNYRAPRTLPVY